MTHEDAQGLRIPPNNTQAEQALIGAVMLDPATWDRVADRASAGDFYRHEHTRIWEAITALSADDKPRDGLSVAEWLLRAGHLDDIGGIDYLAEIDANTASSANATHYADIVRNLSRLRGLIAACAEVSDLAMGGDMGAFDVAMERMTASSGEQGAQGPKDMNAVLRDALEYLEEMRESGEKLIGVPTGFACLDERLSGLQRTDLILLAGRPAMGKSTLAQNIADHAAKNGEHPVVFFSLEMSTRQLGLRSIASNGSISHDAVRGAKLSDEDWPKLTIACATQMSSKLWIDDKSGLSIGDLSARARRIHREHGGLSLVVVDYLQLLNLGRDAKPENRNVEIMKISQGLKHLAKQLDVPVLALSQLNRGLEQRTNKRPVMSDLRDSGGLEQDADVILFVYRDEVYNEDSPDQGIAEVNVAKFRNGQTGVTKLGFDGAHCRFTELSDEHLQALAEQKREQAQRQKKAGINRYEY